ncbi:lipopolysaccharide biosynthesis protein [Amedibacillus sp. YH-ame10]
MKLLKKYEQSSVPFKASLWYTVCNVLQKGMALLATPIFTRIMTQDQFGTFTLFQSWFSILLIFASLNLFQGAFTKGLILYEGKEAQFTSSLLSLSLLGTFIVIVVYCLNIDYWTHVFSLNPIIMIAMFIQIVAITVTEFWAAKERFDFQYKKYITVVLLSTIISLLLSVLTVMNTDSKAEARIYSDTFAKSLFGIIILVYLFKQGKQLYNGKYWKYALLFNLPLIPHFLSTFILNQSDRIMIAKMVGTKEAAIYGVAYTVATMMLLVVNAINNTLVPYIYKKIKATDYLSIMRNTKPLFLLVFTLCLVTMIFAPEIIYIFGGNDYMEAVWIIPPVSASLYFIFVYSMFSTVEYYYQKTGLIAIASCICAIFNILLNYIFISLFGYYAAGYTTLVCYILFSILHYVFYKKIFNKENHDITQLYDIKTIIVLSIVILFFMSAMIYIYQWNVVRYVLITVMVILFIIFKKGIFRVLKKFK